jgi:hypothetical protein
MGGITCFQCKENFWVSDETEAVLRRSSQTFYCPFGHKQAFRQGPTEADKLRDERNRLKQNAARLEDEIRRQRERCETAERSAAAYKGVATRTRNRVKNGVCPCCNRTFQNLAAHMANKHPTFGGGDDVERACEGHTGEATS